MKEICIPPVVSLGLGLALLGGTAAILAKQAPEIQRYLKVRGM